MSRRAFLGILLATLISCAPAATPPALTTTASPVPAAAFPATVVDFQGKSVTMAKRPERIVSIGPSITEFLFALGAADRIVAVDDFSDVPAAAKAKEKVGGVKPNVEKIIALRTDLLLSLRISDGSLERVAAQGIPVLVVEPKSLADAARTAILLGTAIGADGAGLARSIEDGLASVRAKAVNVPKKRVFHEVDASDPTKLFSAGPGSFIHEMIQLAGGINIAAKAASPFPQLSPEEVIRADPEVIVLGDAGYGVTVAEVVARPGWSAITAVRTKRVVPADPNLVHRPGPRIVEAAELYLRIVRETP
ncbi:MAG: ABC transporter substrate-binding protein [Chloroflexi bacterium]|nr:ABC transporter substrate-binding protein [Chloroflexota bacterium]